MDARAADMEQRYRSGQTLVQIGAHYKITRERVRQILAKRGITGADGGAHVAATRNEAARLARRDAAYLKRYGCTYEQYRSVCDRGDTYREDYYRLPRGAYITQRNNAIIRGIPWEFTFWSWWQTWQKSGKWHLRGRGRGKYIMSRPGDVGPYAPHNVEFITHEQNSKDSRTNHPLGFIKAALSTLGSGKGWYKSGLKGRPYQVVVRGKYYGVYATVAEAQAVYRRVCEELKSEMRQALKRAA